MDQEKTGKFITACRKDIGLTQAALAEKLGITDRAVSKWETGRSLPDASIMLELCGILGISVNELLTGEKIAMENYKAIAEKNLADISELEKDKNTKLTKAEFFIGLSGVFISLIMVVCGVFIAESEPFVTIFLCISGCIIAIVFEFYAVLLERDSGYYECQNCHNRYVPSKKAVIFSVHYGSDRVLKCPECSKKCWHKKVITK